MSVMPELAVPQERRLSAGEADLLDLEAEEDEETNVLLEHQDGVATPKTPPLTGWKRYVDSVYCSMLDRQLECLGLREEPSNRLVLVE